MRNEYTDGLSVGPVTDCKWDVEVRLPDGSADGELTVFDAGSDNGDPVAHVDPYGVYDYETSNRFALLMSAAPDLLAALEALFEHCAMIHHTWGDGCNREQATAAEAAARAAIAKAKGVQQ